MSYSFMDDDEKFDICGDLFENFRVNHNDSKVETGLKFIKHIASGFRFRYQSEIDKKSYSVMKTEKNESPILQVISSVDNAFISLELVTQNLNYHFNEIYEVARETNIVPMNAAIIKINLEKSGTYEIKLDNFGIRKMKNREALTKIKKIYPNITDAEAKEFFNKEKDIVILKVTLFQNDEPFSELFSNKIKSQISKENKSIKIKHFSPKVVAGYGEQLIVVLEKKITSDNVKGFIHIDDNKVEMKIKENDMRTFIFILPDVKTDSPKDAKFYMTCDQNEDFKLIKFLPHILESRKRKSIHVSVASLPLKKCNIDETSVQRLFPESGNFDKIETDNANPTNFEINQLSLFSRRILEDNYSDDSGFHASSLHDQSFPCIEMESEETDDDDDEWIETEGLKNKANRKPEQIQSIFLPSKKRSINSQLDTDKSTAATKQILTEVSRIGHDYAFGSEKVSLFERIANQLPVVFTLQDEYGDTPLNNAILKGNEPQALEILHIVKEHCSWALDLVNTSGHTALILAPACKVSAEFIKNLLSAGCNLNVWDDTGKSSIVYALEYQNIPALSVLLEHVQKTKMSNLLLRFTTSYYTLLQIAIMNSFKKGIQMLLELKNVDGDYLIDVNETGLISGETALHTAVSHDCDLDILNMLLKRPDILINKLMMSKETALDIAIKMKSKEIIDILISFKAVTEISHVEVDYNEESSDDEELDEMEIYSESISNNEMTMDYNSLQSVDSIIKSMENLSLKGEVKTKMIEILLCSTGPVLSVTELKSIVKPIFKSIFNKNGNTDETNKKDLSELLERFNCLPDSVGILLRSLEKIGRPDLKHKIIKYFKY